MDDVREAWHHLLHAAAMLWAEIVEAACVAAFGTPLDRLARHVARRLGWVVHELDRHVDVRPRADCVAHQPDVDCICGPNVDWDGDIPVVVHHPADGRN